MDKGSYHSLAAGVYAAIRDALHNGEYRPGDRLREEEVARRLNVSRTPVREALGLLEARRIVENVGGRGLVIRRLDLRDIMELYATLEIVEGAAGGLAADHASPSEMEAMRSFATGFASNIENAGELMRFDCLFHQSIHRAARNRYLETTIGDIRDEIGMLGATTYRVPHRVPAVVEEHDAILEAIAARDVQGAQDRSRAHVRNALRARMRMAQHA